MITVIIKSEARMIEEMCFVNHDDFLGIELLGSDSTEIKTIFFIKIFLI
jgi:hypothetical protein